MAHIVTFPNANTGSPAPKCTFDSFVVGDSNREAFFAAKFAAGHSGHPGTPLILCGGSGLGKTHLLHAIHAEMLAQDPSANVKRLNADEFISCLIHAVQTGTADMFRAECQNADAFLLDDIQFFVGKQRTQEELLLILEARCQSNRCTVLTLDCPAEELEATERDFRNQFPNLILAAIAEPGYEVRATIIRTKAADLDLPLSEDEVDLIARHIPGSLRNIQGVLNRINLYRSFPETFPDAPSISEIVRSVSESPL